MSFKVVHNNRVVTPRAYNISNGTVLIDGQWLSLDGLQILK